MSRNPARAAAAIPAGVGFRGTFRHGTGHGHEHEAILCCPGDWHAIKAGLADGEGWSTLRLGPFLVALSPLRRPGVGVVDGPADLEGAAHPVARRPPA